MDYCSANYCLLTTKVYGQVNLKLDPLYRRIIIVIYMDNVDRRRNPEELSAKMNELSNTET